MNGAAPHHDPVGLKRARPLAGVVEEHGIALRPRGRTLVAPCPFHDDGQRPNLHVYSEPDPAGDHYHCQTPDTRVLLADLRWKPLGDLHEGETLLAFDEHAGGPGWDRRFRPSTVLQLGADRRPCSELVFDDGSRAVCTPDHRWLVRRGSSLEWRVASRLRVGRIVDLASPGVPEDSWLAGYIAGILDGEGSLVMQPRRVMLTITQKLGLVLDTVQEVLTGWGIRYSVSVDGRGLGHLNIGGKDSVLRLLAKTRPPRLMAKWRPDSLGGTKRTFGARERRVVASRDVGPQDIVLIRTETATLIADGLASHNCYACGAHGDAIEFVMRRDDVSFVEACARLAAVPPVRSAIRSVARRPAPTPQPERRRDRLTLAEQVVMDAAAALYQRRLWETPRALAYLEARGLPEEVVRACGLGYADGRSLEPLLRQHDWVRLGEHLGLLRRVGARDGTRPLRELLGGRIVVPELRGGHTAWFIGRWLPGAGCRAPAGGSDAAARSGAGPEDPPKYLSLPGERPVLGQERVLGKEEAFLVEGVFGYLTAVAWGLPACSPCGTHLPPERLGFLARADRVWGLLDPDEAGRGAADRFGAHLGARWRSLWLPGGAELDDLAPRPDGREEFRSFFEAARSARENQQENDHAH